MTFQQDFTKSKIILLQISLQISLWMSFVDFTADFIPDFTMDAYHYGFHCRFHVTDFTEDEIMDFNGNFITCTRISPMSTRFHVKSIAFDRISLKWTGFHYGFNFGFHYSDRSTDFMPEINRISWNSLAFHARNPLHLIIQEVLFTFMDFREAVSHEIIPSGRFHADITWNPPIQQEFTKSNRISQDFMKSTRFNTIS